MRFSRSTELKNMTPGAKVRFNTEELSRSEIRTMLFDYGVNDRIIKGIMENDLSHIYTVSGNRSGESLKLEEFKGYGNNNIRRSMFVMVTRELELLEEAEEL